MTATIHRLPFDADTLRARAAAWRRTLEDSEPLVLVADPDADPAATERMKAAARLGARAVPEVGGHAVVTRDQGYHAAGFLPHPVFDRALHLSLRFTDAYGNSTPHHHPAARHLCEGFFGAACLPLVQVERPSPKAPHDVTVDRWRYRLFVMEDWSTPIVGAHVREYLRWTERAAYLATIQPWAPLS
jgi:hypothetical protein